MWWTKKAYDLWRFAGGCVTEVWRTLFPPLIPASSNIDAASTKVDFQIDQNINIMHNRICHPVSKILLLKTIVRYT